MYNNNDPVNNLCHKKLFFYKYSISWINSTMNSMKIGVQEILVKPQHLFYDVLQTPSFNILNDAFNVYDLTFFMPDC